MPLEAARDAGMKFVIIKATQGLAHNDPAYLGHLAAARAAGLLVGAYHFYDYTADGVAQADHFVDTLEASGILTDSLPPAVDIECLSRLGTADQAFAAAQLRAFVERVYARVGRYPIVYTSRPMWHEVTGADRTFGKLPLWVACWRCAEPALPAGWKGFSFWQIGARAVPPFPWKVDANIYWGTDEALVALRTRPMVIDGGAATTNDPVLSIDLSGLDGAAVHYSADAGATWSDWTPATPTGTFTIDSGEGEHTVWAQLRSSRKTLGPIVSDSIVFDSIGPVVSATLLGFRPARMDAERRAPIALSWSASDAASSWWARPCLWTAPALPRGGSTDGGRRETRRGPVPTPGWASESTAGSW